MTPDGGRGVVQVEVRRSSHTRMKLIDCDVHHALRSVTDLYPYLAPRWRAHLESYGSAPPVPFVNASPYPKATPALSRGDSWPESGPPGSDLVKLQRQLLDLYRIEFALLHLLFPQGMDQRNQEFGAALCRALNSWVVEHWTSKDKRLKAAIMVPGEDAAAAVAEIEHWAGHPDFVQVSMVTHTIEPLGRRRYWPIYAAAVAAGLPVGLHTSGYNGHPVTTGAGWCSYYVEEQHNVAISQQMLATSLVCEGVFARFPALKVVIVEAGIAWVPAVAWRLDAHWKRMKDEVPHLTRLPSEYMREHLWYTTQPSDEPENPEHLRRMFDWLGWDRILFATDYPHWDMDNPDTAFKFKMSEAERQMVFNANARAVYRLG